MASSVTRGGHEYFRGHIRVGPSDNQVCLVLQGEGAPTNGAGGTGAGFAGIGSLYVNNLTGQYYYQSNNKNSPTWHVLGGGGGGGGVSPAEYYLSGSKTIAMNRSTTFAPVVDWKTSAMNMPVYDGAVAIILTVHLRTMDVGTSVTAGLFTTVGGGTDLGVVVAACSATDADYQGINQMQDIDVTAALGTTDILPVYLVAKGSDLNADYFCQGWLTVYPL